MGPLRGRGARMQWQETCSVCLLPLPLVIFKMTACVPQAEARAVMVMSQFRPLHQLHQCSGNILYWATAGPTVHILFLDLSLEGLGVPEVLDSACPTHFSWNPDRP